MPLKKNGLLNILIPKRNTKKIIHMFFSSITSKIIFSDLNFDSTINSLSHNLKIMMFRLTLVALPRKI